MFPRLVALKGDLFKNKSQFWVNLSRLSHLFLSCVSMVLLRIQALGLNRGA